VRSVGAAHHDAELAVGDLIVPLASLIAIPLVLDEVGPVDPAVPQVPVGGRAIVTGRMPCGRVPPDLPLALALTAFDVFPAATYARDLAAPGDHVLVLGAGHAGLLAVAAARTAVGEQGTISVVDVSADALERVRAIDPAAHVVRADVTAPLAVAAALPAPADLTLQCTSVIGAEGSALMATAPRGTIVFFSTATRFAAAALGTESVGTQARLIIPNGFTDDRGAYALHLVRTVPALRAALEARR
jgi:L-erythro-3,5-diaminohexanoate dehydrogenase